ncbi:MAG: hypothetical protein FWG56_06735, partial [Desulfovibrionaceae bacterium]|nr:hypothetical protein [Desulfovibrionaceae bacterium]
MRGCIRSSRHGSVAAWRLIFSRKLANPNGFFVCGVGLGMDDFCRPALFSGQTYNRPECRGAAVFAASPFNAARKRPMTILVAYVSRPEGQAALNKGIEIAT